MRTVGTALLTSWQPASARGQQVKMWLTVGLVLLSVTLGILAAGDPARIGDG